MHRSPRRQVPRLAPKRGNLGAGFGPHSSVGLSNLPRIKSPRRRLAAGDLPECHRRDLTRYVRLPHRVSWSEPVCNRRPFYVSPSRTKGLRKSNRIPNHENAPKFLVFLIGYRSPLLVLVFSWKLVQPLEVGGIAVVPHYCYCSRYLVCVYRCKIQFLVLTGISHHLAEGNGMYIPI